MSKRILLFVCMLCSVRCDAGWQEWCSSIYALFARSSNQQVNNKLTQEPRTVECITEMGKDCNEFLNNSRYPAMALNTHFKKIDPSTCSPKDKALYNFGHDMLKSEAKWYSWHISYAEQSVEGKIKKKVLFHEMKLSEQDKIRLDLNSPYYKHFACSSDASSEGFSGLNAVENQSYHDELKFMKTRLAFMKMYEVTDKCNLTNAFMMDAQTATLNEKNRKKAYNYSQR